MVYNLFNLTFCLMISEIVSQTLTVSCIRSGESVTLSCETTDFTNAVLFYLTGVNKGGCTGGTCLTGISGYNQPTQSGTVTEMVIAAYDHSRDGGDWTCNYGSSSSGIKAAEIGNYCSVDNECGWCKSDCDDGRNCIIAIAFGVGISIVLFIIIVLYLCGWGCFSAGMLVCCNVCCIICKCIEENEREPESNNTDELHRESNNTNKLHYLCCTRGGTFSKQHFTCLHCVGRVSNDNTITNDPPPYTGR